MNVRRRALKAEFIASLIAAVGLCSGCAEGHAAADEQFPTHREIAGLLSTERRYVPRLSGSNRWQRCASIDSGGSSLASISCDSHPIDATSVSRIARIMAQRAVTSHHDQLAEDDRVWALASLDLAAGPSTARATTIVEDLRHIAERHPQVAELHNDVAVASLVQYATSGNAVYAIMALDQVELASQQDPRSGAIAFNRAVSRQTFGLPQQAAVSWRTAVDSSVREWRDESAMRSNALRKPPLSAVDDQVLRQQAIRSLLTRCVSAALPADPSSAHWCDDSLPMIGRALALHSGDSSMIHLADEWRSDSGGFAAAATRYTRGHDQLRTGAYADAVRSLEDALAHAPKMQPSAITDWIRDELGTARQFQARYADAESLLLVAQQDARKHGDLALEAHTHWGLGLTYARAGRTGLALDRYRDASVLFDRLRERSNQAFMISQYGDVLFLLGQDDAALTRKLSAIQLGSGTSDRTSRASALMAFAQQLRDEHYPYAALAVLQEAADVARESDRIADRAEILVRLIRALDAVRLTDRADSLVTRMHATADSVDDPILHERLAMEVSQTEGTLYADARPDLAISRFDSVAGYFRRRGIVFSLVEPLTSAATLRIRIGKPKEAEANLREAMRAIDTQAVHAFDPSAGRAVRASRSQTYVQLAKLALTRGDTAGAFAAIERGRSNPYSSGAVGKLDPRIAYLSYEILDDRCVLWLVTKRTMRMVTIGAPTADLLRNIFSLRSSAPVPQDSAAADEAARALYAALISPVRADLRDASEIVVVADGPLQLVPFALLLDPDGKRLIEAAPVSYARAVAPLRPATFSGNIEIVGDPEFDHTLFPALPNLNGAYHEATFLKAAVMAAHLITRDDAGRTSVLSAIQDAGIFHFAGHARLVSREPRLSHLVLARSPGGIDANVLTAADIARLRLGHMHLVVLSSCGTDQANTSRDDSSNGLADAFLNAGSDAVVSSKWQADDSVTPKLMVAMYRHLLSGMSASAALRAGQLELLTAGGAASSPAVWAGFNVVRQ